MSALVVGSMVPDLPLFVAAGPVRYEHTHSILGIVTLDVVFGMLAWALWETVMRAPVVDALPGWARRATPQHRRVHGFRWLLVPVAVGIGAATHVVWDEFTHPGRWGESHIEWLGQVHAGLPGLKWAQYGSGVGGLLIIAITLTVLVGRARTQPTPDRQRPRLAPWVVLGPVIAAVLTAVVATLAADSVRAAAFNSITRGALAAGVVGVLTALVWHLAPRPPVVERP